MAHINMWLQCDLSPLGQCDALELVNSTMCTLFIQNLTLIPEEPLARHCKRSFSKGLVASFIFSFTCFLWVFENVNNWTREIHKIHKNPTFG